MTAQITQQITALPDGPDFNTQTPEVFSQTAVASVLAQQGLPPELNTFAGQANALATEVSAVSAAVAAAKAVAENAAIVAQGAAAIAQSATGATAWDSLLSYAFPTSVISPGDQRVYRKRTAASISATDPKDDPTNWLDVQTDAVLQLSGGEMLGPMQLAADPAGPMEPVTLQYHTQNSTSRARLHAHSLSFA